MRTDLYDVVIGLVEEELSLYKELGLLVDTEELKVSSSDMEGLLRVLEEKQSVISRQEILLERWSAISAELGLSEGREGPAFWNAVARYIGQNGYNQIVRKVDEIRELGLALLEREKIIRLNLEANLAEMRKSLVSIGKNRIAVQGYSSNIGVY